jgi:TonB-linked SusC/RagA family outer membrane protein
MLDEIVVVGYGTQRKVNLTGAVSQVNSEVLESRPITNLGQGLQGVIPNLNININSGSPGRGSTFNIRGNTSINGGDPLVLVDGVVMDINLINPEDIKSVSVLKDAASSAIYGARAAYGVVLITTKTGQRSDKPKISFNANYSWNRPTAYPEYINSMEYANWMNAAFTTTSGSNYFDDETMGYITAHFNDPSQPSVFHHSSDPSSTWRYAGNTDWTKEMLKGSYPMQQYNVNVSGGSENLTYYTSAGYFSQDGLLRWFDESYERFNVMQNVSYKVTDWMKFGLKTSLNIADKRDIPDNKWGSFADVDNLYMGGDSRPLMPVYHPDGHFAGYSGNGYYTNMPAFLSQGGDRKSRTNDAWITGTFQLTPVEGLLINLDYTYNYFNRVTTHIMKEYWDYDAAGPATLFPHTTPNWSKKDENNDRYNALNLFAEYEKTFGKHYLKGLIGFNQESKSYNWFGARRSGLITNEVPYMEAASGERATTDGTNEWAIRGAFFRLNYVFDERYLLEVNGRYDGSSRFPSEDRFKFFPSVSLGWRISNETFWEPVKSSVNELKLRASYGTLGNQAPASDSPNYYPYIATYGTEEINYILNGAKPLTVRTPGLVSPALTWETVNQVNAGFDFGLLNNKLTASFDWYQRETKDMLAPSTAVSAILGTNEPTANAADLRTRGYEIVLSWNDRLDNEFSYGIDVSFSDYQAEITKYNNPAGLLNTYYAGQKLGSIWGYVTEGLFATDAEAQSYDQSTLVGHPLLAGDLKFKDLDGKPGITRGTETLDDHGDMTIIGNSTPRYAFGARLNATWKGFDAAMFFQGLGSRDFYPGNTFFLNHYTSEWAVPQKVNTDYWTTDNPDAYFPRPRLNGGEVNTKQTRYLQNGAYVRCKQLTLGYTVPERLTGKVNISNLRVYFSGQNLFEFSGAFDIFDPEADRVNWYPLTRSFSLGLNLTF